MQKGERIREKGEKWLKLSRISDFYAYSLPAEIHLAFLTHSMMSAFMPVMLRVSRTPGPLTSFRLLHPFINIYFHIRSTSPLTHLLCSITPPSFSSLTHYVRFPGRSLFPSHSFSSPSLAHIRPHSSSLLRSCSFPFLSFTLRYLIVLCALCLSAPAIHQPHSLQLSCTPSLSRLSPLSPPLPRTHI